MMFRTLLACALLSSGCIIEARGTVRSAHHVQATAYTSPSYVTVNQPPPPLRAALAQGNKPSSDSQWISGHWVLVAVSYTHQTLPTIVSLFHYVVAG